MAKLKIMSIELAAPVSVKDDVLDFLQRKGVLELSIPEENEKFLLKNFSEEASEINKKLTLLNTAGTLAEKINPVKKPITAFLEPRTQLSEAQFALFSKSVVKTLQLCEEILAFDKERIQQLSQMQRNKALIDELRPWENFDIPLAEGSTRKTAYAAGSFRRKITEEELSVLLAQKLPSNDCIETEIIKSDDEITAVAVFMMREDRDEVVNVLRTEGFISAPDCRCDSVRDEIKKLLQEISDSENRISVCNNEIAERAKQREDIKFAEDYFSVMLEKYQAMEKISESDRVFYIRGYIAKRDGDKIKTYLEKNFDAAVNISEPADDEDVPVILSNNFFSAPLEGITGMYSLPGKYDPDPTSIMAFFYYFFFGMMLSDAGYGLLMVLATGGVLLFKKNSEQKIKNMCRMYFFCGLSTVFWGAMYGSWFGDMINVIRTEFLGLPEARLYIWMEPVNSLMELMVYCFLFGLVHLFVGVGVKAVTEWKNGDKLGAFCDSVPTYLTILGIAPIFFGLFTEVPPIFSKIGTPVLIVGLILVILTGGRSSKSIAGKLGGGLYEVYNLIGGYLGDVLSYARLLALGLSTGVIAEVMNMLGVLPSNKILKLIMFIAVAIVGHIANFAINIIGAYVHTNRLQYVEFFGKFYEGGGRAFVPLEAKTKYYKFKEENQL